MLETCEFAEPVGEDRGKAGGGWPGGGCDGEACSQPWEALHAGAPKPGEHRPPHWPRQLPSAMAEMIFKYGTVVTPSPNAFPDLISIVSCVCIDMLGSTLHEESIL